MNSMKLIPVVFLGIIISVGGIAYKFYSDNQTLISKNSVLKGEKSQLAEKNEKLRQDYDVLSKLNQELEDRWSRVEDELNRLEKERDEWENKYNEISKEKEALLGKLQEKPKVQMIGTPIVSEVSSGDGLEEEYWADFIKQKAELETRLEDIRKEILDANSKVAELSRTNSEITMTADQLTKEKDRLTREIKFKERMMKIMSRDLVNERESKKTTYDEVSQLRKENVELKRDLVILNRDKVKAQEEMRALADKKAGLENKVMDIENILREKNLAFEELHQELADTISTATVDESAAVAVMKEPVAVELPPIVVKPETKTIQGKIIAVNGEEKFVILDIGQDSGLKAGAQLKVTRSGREIGTLQIIEVRKEISAADILTTAANFTIQDGDSVATK